MLKSYRKIVGDEKVNEIKREAKALKDKHIIHFNSTYYGGGVAEILNSMVPLMNELKIKTGWRLLKGAPDFFSVTKKFHNALQGGDIRLTKVKKNVYIKWNKRNSTFMHIADHDAIIIHDPQPLPLINYYPKKAKWIWRCHIDISHPHPGLWEYLYEFIHKYDRMIVSDQAYIKKGIRIPVDIIRPSIDPLNYKNKPLIEKRIDSMLRKFGIPQDKPIISQVSRFDKWKDPLGVIKAYKMAKKKCKCRLVLLGNMATDDPEGQEIFRKVVKAANGVRDIHVINFESDILVNAVQRSSAVVLQKSIREGFGLTVSEALWKGVPVVAGNVGGIPSQIVDGVSGFLVNNIPQCAEKIAYLLRNPKVAAQMGKAGHEHVKENFLITRHLMDYLLLLKKVLVK